MPSIGLLHRLRRETIFSMSYTDMGLAILVILLALVCVAGVAMAERRVRKKSEGRPTVLTALAILFWLGLTAAAAKLGWMRNYHATPPPLVWVVAPSLLAMLLLVMSPFGAILCRGIKFQEIVALQAFRLPVELILYGYFVEGRIPLEMTFEGRNFDILTAVTALILAPLIARKKAGRKAVWIWNLMGLGLLINIMTIALLSAPGPLHLLHVQPLNSLPFGWPSLWILFCVMVAFASHLLVFRKLSMRKEKSHVQQAE